MIRVSRMAAVLVGVLTSASGAQEIRLSDEFPLVRELLLNGRTFSSAAAMRAAPQPVAHPDLPGDAKEMVSGFETDAAAIRQKAEAEVQARRLRLITELQQAQDRYTREAKLDEAVAIRDTIRRLKSAHLNVRANPGSLYEYRDLEGHSLYFEVTGRVGGSLWGSDVYTGDSDLATAAVHAGALAVGQTGIVEVRIVPSPPQHAGSLRNGATSSSWGPYPFSYSVRKWIPDAPMK